MSDFTGSAIDHMGIAVSETSYSQAFYESVLRPLGITLLMSILADPPGPKPRRLGFGSGGKPFFWLYGASVASQGVHIALIAPTRESVDAFHAAGIAAGGRDNGPPGIRPHYHADYYAAYVLTPDGVNLEAVCQVAS
ncbi:MULTISPECIES: VOC family protein [Pseudomonas]|uniref:Glyoxalase/Bleomycin resistance protein/Dioxygenase superfamily protein n=2 Tax=Pseudomonas TaxID=286 RepID=A0A0D0SHN2_PSEFL|nr:MULTISPECIES: VOC family protein [Pseudomonas]AZE61101.1 Lactoylglutathione lyase [Pseudomonas synxantha]KIR21533.1 Glyoxalase/Bleomycin resistance protein/Dioxygenase superfamily protein [Pseudomonas fluorescens]MBV4482206.1 VOC family protein [Pseudomonas khavaziana]